MFCKIPAYCVPANIQGVLISFNGASWLEIKVNLMIHIYNVLIVSKQIPLK